MVNDAQTLERNKISAPSTCTFKQQSKNTNVFIFNLYLRAPGHGMDDIIHSHTFILFYRGPTTCGVGGWGEGGILGFGGLTQMLKLS